MPLFRIDLRKGKDLSYRQEIGRVVYEAMFAVGVGVPANARFQVVTEHDADNFLFDPDYLGIDRSDDLVIIQITWNEGRPARRRPSTRRSSTGSERHRASAPRMSSSTSSTSGLRTRPSARAKPSTRLEKERLVSGVERPANNPLCQILTDYK
jgi:Tautomerase enzyme